MDIPCRDGEYGFLVRQRNAQEPGRDLQDRAESSRATRIPHHCGATWPERSTWRYVDYARFNSGFDAPMILT